VKRLHYFESPTLGAFIVSESEFLARSEHITLERALFRTVDPASLEDTLELTQPMERFT
jgi:hypothetical protein